MKEMTRLLSLLLLATVGLSAAETPYAPRIASGTIGRVERLDPALDELLEPDARIERLAEGFDWSEGPVWMTHGNCLVFSDVPRNVVWKWREFEGLSEYLKPSGLTGVPRERR